MTISPNDVFPAALYALYDLRYGSLSDVAILKAGQVTGTIAYDTRVNLYDDLGYPENTPGLVLADPNVTYNGFYIKVGAIDAGYWSFQGVLYFASINLPYTTAEIRQGIIYKDTEKFLYDFTYGDNGTVVTIGKNIFLGINAGNFTMGSSATADYHGSYNIGIGEETLKTVTTGFSNIGIGRGSLQDDTTGYQNTAVGYTALRYNTTGMRNVAVGAMTLNSNLAGIDNIAIGVNALLSNTNHYNIAIGSYALDANTTGYSNYAVGYNALGANINGTYNYAFGHLSLSTAESSTYNNAFGSQTLQYTTTGTRNCAMGHASLQANTTGEYNTAIGHASLLVLSSGSYNTAIGGNSGRYIADGSTANSTADQCTYLGYGARASAIGMTNEIVIGYTAVGNGSNSVTLGGAAITKTVLRGSVGIGTVTPVYPLEVVGTVKQTGSIKNIATKTTNYTLTVNDDTVLVNGTATITLPAASDNTGRIFTIKRIHASLTTTIATIGAEYIDGSSGDITITAQWGYRILQSNGTTWYIIGTYL
jgi:hypothetical protein